MTAPTDHPSVDVLADLHAGVLPTDQIEAVGAHAGSCATCTEQLAQLEAITTGLAALPPETMPESVAARLEAAIAAAVVAAPATVVPISSAQQWWRRRSTIAVAGAVAAAAVAGIVVVSSRSSGPVASAHKPPSPAQQAAAIKEWRTGRNYGPKSVGSWYTRLVTATPPAAGAGVRPGTGAGINPGASPSATFGPSSVITIADMQSSREAVVACGHILSGDATVSPLAIDFAEFNGKPAAIVVLPAAHHVESLDVFVVLSSCSNQALDIYFRRVPRSGG
jgi:hypothetical protein